MEQTHERATDSQDRFSFPKMLAVKGRQGPRDKVNFLGVAISSYRSIINLYCESNA